jgi:serine/threonine protein kinase
MSICPTCLTKYADDAKACAKDGAALVPEETFASIDKDLQNGDAVGEYRIESKIGEGGFGAVYRAVHPVIGKTAAVKVLGRQFSANANMVSRFIAEARAVNQIRHRNIIDIFAFGSLPDGRQYYIMELLDGLPFDKYLDERKRLSLPQALPILRGIARALDAAHGKGILHRDLKPENVFLVFDEDGRVEPKLLDFGLVKLMDDAGGSGSGSGSGSHKTKTGTPMGTPYYMSPEQCRGLEVDRRTDIYAFGALTFQVLTGGLPFEGESAMDILFKHMTNEPPKASERCAEVPPTVDAVLVRMMAKEKIERPASLGEALDQLVAAAQSGGMVLDSARVPLPAGPRESIGMGATLIADSRVPPATPSVPVRVAQDGMAAQTFLGSESDVHAPVREKSRVPIFVGLVAVVALVAGAGIFVSLKKTPATPSSGIVQSATIPTPAVASSPAKEEPKPAKNENVDVRVAGAPAGAIVSANGAELGVAPGPFVVKNGAETKLTISAKGYKSKDVTVTPTANVVVDVSLEKAPATTVKKKGGGINPDLEGFDSK